MTTERAPRRRHRFEPTRHELPKVAPRANDWWRGAVIYQIYPRSFADADGNGIGDLPGIERRLDYVASLGVDAVWISPFFKSPMRDFGYDVADYCDVDPIFGTLEDFDRVLEKAHRLGLKVLVDFVPSHTSDRHPWFQEARASRANPKADWYVFADPKPDGTPPNNWLSVFGGPAWEWEPRRGQYYLHNFLKEQPDLNFHNPEVIGALLAQARFWLERGVDGFRLDAIDFGVHDLRLRDNPPRRRAANTGGFSGSPWMRQVHLYNKARPELSDIFFKPLFALTESYEGGRVLLAEIAGDRALERMAEYTGGGGIDMAYSFDLLSCPPHAAGIRGVIDELEARIDDGWACWSFGNHDVQRAVTRFAEGGPVTPELRKLIPTILVTLRGTSCLYQGEELGLGEAELAFEDLRDPWGLNFWPAFKGRDGCRTPMPWTSEAPHAGFTEGAQPWLPVPPEHLELSVAAQELRPDSPLNHVRELLAWRKTQPALIRGSLRFVGRWRELLAFERALDGDRILCAFNLGRRLRHETMPFELGDKLLAAPGASVRGRRVNLPAHGWLFARIDAAAAAAGEA